MKIISASGIMRWLLTLITGLYAAFVLKMLWGWFINPWIESAPKMNFIIAYGICIIVRFLTYNISLSDMALMDSYVKDGNSKGIHHFIHCMFATQLIICTNTLFMGWVLSYFV